MGAGNTAGLIVPFTRKKDQNFTETITFIPLRKYTDIEVPQTMNVVCVRNRISFIEFYLATVWNEHYSLFKTENKLFSIRGMLPFR